MMTRAVSLALLVFTAGAIADPFGSLLGGFFKGQSSTAAHPAQATGAWAEHPAASAWSAHLEAHPSDKAKWEAYWSAHQKHARDAHSATANWSPHPTQHPEHPAFPGHHMWERDEPYEGSPPHFSWSDPRPAGHPEQAAHPSFDGVPPEWTDHPAWSHLHVRSVASSPTVHHGWADHPAWTSFASAHPSLASKLSSWEVHHPGQTHATYAYPTRTEHHFQARATSAGTYVASNITAPCAKQPGGHGPVPNPSDDKSFAAYQPFAITSTYALAPAGWSRIFYNLNASVLAGANGNTYLGYFEQTSYNAGECAAKCDGTAGCVGFNLYFERDPSLNPAAECQDPAPVTAIKCALFGSPVKVADAINFGQWREKFHVVIAGSNGYMKLPQQACSAISQAWNGRAFTYGKMTAPAQQYSSATSTAKSLSIAKTSSTAPGGYGYGGYGGYWPS